MGFNSAFKGLNHPNDNLEMFLFVYLPFFNPLAEKLFLDGARGGAVG